MVSNFCQHRMLSHCFMGLRCWQIDLLRSHLIVYFCWYDNTFEDFYWKAKICAYQEKRLLWIYSLLFNKYLWENCMADDLTSLHNWLLAQSNSWSWIYRGPELNFQCVIYALVLNGAQPSAGTVLTVNLDKFLKLLMILCPLGGLNDLIPNGRHELAISCSTLSVNHPSRHNSWCAARSCTQTLGFCALWSICSPGPGQVLLSLGVGWLHRHPAYGGSWAAMHTQRLPLYRSPLLCQRDCSLFCQRDCSLFGIALVSCRVEQTVLWWDADRYALEPCFSIKTILLWYPYSHFKDKTVRPSCL